MWSILMIDIENWDDDGAQLLLVLLVVCVAAFPWFGVSVVDIYSVEVTFLN